MRLQITYRFRFAAGHKKQIVLYFLRSAFTKWQPVTGGVRSKQTRS